MGEQTTEKFDRLARGYSAHDYADPERYAARRARVVILLGPLLEPGDSLVDLGCGDGVMSVPLAAYGLRYRGVDASTGMIEEARTLHPDLPFEVAAIEDYEPPKPVDATMCLRAFYYPRDRRAFFRRVASYTRGKFVFDFRPAVHDPTSVTDDLRAAGFAVVALRPFFLPQQRRLPTPLVPAVYALEHTGPVAGLALRRVGRMFCAAVPRR
jgi:SAM-dependent methyltransferase